ncbi:MAG: hypothetical protein Q7T03_11350 [Deltaproteobacteria bacterium]|nr:hypothetical protein [Deltaproteobacteria bacterium]
MSKKIFLVLIFLSLALLFAGSRIKVVQLGYEVSRLKSGAAEMVRNNSLLKSKAAEMQSTGKLAEWALKLEMTTPAASQVLFIKE